MDDIYSNLDNYNEEETIQNLQKENKELKFQLGDLNIKLETLQKDFDRLSSEHRKLESNFSSLLKTAKAEVERKTQTIANLNAEKDKLVLKTLQNGGNRNFMRNAPVNRRENQKNKMTNKSTQTDKQNVEVERRESRFSPKEDMIRPNNDLSVKENMSQKIVPDVMKTRTQIRNRRKSLPVSAMPPVFSSDDEDIPSHEGNFNTREYPDRHFDKSYRSSVRTSECFNMEDRNVFHYDQTKDFVKTRHHRNDVDKFRPHDRSEFPQRNRRESPGRHRRRGRDIYEDKRSEFDRHRRIESPPNDRSNQYPLRQHPNFERTRYQDNDRYSNRGHDRFTPKHKVPEYEEPKSKKMKPNTYQRQHEDEKWQAERYPIPNDYDKQFNSCQSPDINHLETNPNHQVREIKLSASSQLDDPRKSSDKYVTEKGKDTLIAVHSLNIDIQRVPLENSPYDIEIIKMPVALKKLPPSNRLANDIYNIVENPEIDISMESGEIPLDLEDEIHIQKRVENKEMVQNTVNKSSLKTDPVNVNPPQSLSSYTIPKVKSGSSNSQTNKNKGVKTDPSDKRKVNSKPDNTVDVKTNISKSKKKVVNPDRKNDTVSHVKEAPVVISPPSLLPLLDINFKDEQENNKLIHKIVEDDLELSDETCDYTETVNSTVPNVADKNASVKCDTKTQSLDKVDEVTCQTDTSKDKSKLPDSHDKKVKPKRRQSKHKPQEQSKHKPEEQSKPDVPQSEKSAKRKPKEKDVANKEIKHKFSELFGDSSSLILPEDLGIPSVQVPFSQPIDPYVPIFEDAQDAIDVNVNKEPIVLDNLEINKPPDDKTIESKVPPKEDKAEIENKQNTIESEKILPIQQVYQNLEVGLKPIEDNVKTIIISSGVQPTYTETPSTNEIVKTVEERAKLPIKVDLKALATSTPHKLSSLVPAIIETNGHTNTNKDVSLDSTKMMDNSDFNIEPKSNEADIPDVRIVVKRRRKVCKKP